MGNRHGTSEESDENDPFVLGDQKVPGRKQARAEEVVERSLKHLPTVRGQGERVVLRDEADVILVAICIEPVKVGEQSLIVNHEKEVEEHRHRGKQRGRVS